MQLAFPATLFLFKMFDSVLNCADLNFSMEMFEFVWFYRIIRNAFDLMLTMICALKIFSVAARQPGSALSKHNYIHVRHTNERRKKTTTKSQPSHIHLDVARDTNT